MDDDAHEIGLGGGDQADGLVWREVGVVMGREDGGEVGVVLGSVFARLEEVFVGLLGLSGWIVRVLSSGGDGEGEEVEGGGAESEAGWRKVAEDGNGGDRRHLDGEVIRAGREL